MAAERAPGTTRGDPPPVQASLLDEHPCPTCGGTGRRPDRDTGETVKCRVCLGAGTVGYDPDDPEIPF